MTVEIFISWSGPESRGVARALHEWIPLVVPSAHVFISGVDIEAGTRWSKVLAEKLDKTDVGVFVVTSSNLRSRWLNFEAGAIAKQLESARVVPLLYGVTRSSLSNSPLDVFQELEWSKDAVWKLMQIINKATGELVADENLTKLVDRLWPDLAAEVAGVPGPVTEATPLRFLLGDVGCGEPIRLVLPEFEIVHNKIDELVRERSANLDPEEREALNRILDDEALRSLFGKPDQRKGGEDVDDVRMFAMNDLRALMTVSQSLEREGARFQLVLDADLRHKPGLSPLVAFGMTTNSVTNTILKPHQDVDGTPLFTHEGADLDAKPGAEFVRLANGDEYAYAEDRYGLIARVTPPISGATGKWLICAGLGVTGTEAAANYLCSNQASTLAATVGAHDFVKVVHTRSGAPGFCKSTNKDTVFADGTSPSD